MASAGCSDPPAKSTGPAAAPPPQQGRAVVEGTTAPGAIVSLEPTSQRDFPAPAGARVMDQYGQQFLPQVLVAQVGQRVEFRSSEDVLHNVRVDEATSRTTLFNVATLPFEAYTHTFEKPGYYNVSCDVHPAMRAYILVAPTPYTAIADARGAFAIADVEPGQYTARVLGTATPMERTVEVTAPRTELTFAIR